MDGEDLKLNLETKESVSLPGAGGTEPTILEVFNNNNLVNSDANNSTSAPIQQLSNQQQQHQQQQHQQQQHQDNTLTHQHIENRNEQPLIDHQQNICTIVKSDLRTENNDNSFTSDQVKDAVADNGNNNASVIDNKITKTTISPDQEVLLTKFTSDGSTLSSDCTRNKQQSSTIDTHLLESENSKIYDIESHLIDTYEGLEISKTDYNGVNVFKLPPAKEELSKPSVIDSENSIKTVIEIEPNQPIVHKRIETTRINAQHNKPKIELNSEQVNRIGEIENTNLDNSSSSLITENHIINQFTNTEEPHIEETILCSNNENNIQKVNNLKESNLLNNNNPHIEESNILQNTNDNLQQSDKIIDLNPKQIDTVDHLKQNEIEISSSILQSPALIRQIEISLNKNSTTDNHQELITESNKTASNEINFESKIEKESNKENDKTTLNHSLDEKLTTNLETEQETNTTDSKEKKTKPTQKILSVDGLPVTTPEEEEHKKSFLDSIPQLQDSPNTSVRSYKEYQPLLEYLRRREKSPPPVPAQTYRWEDLRRAREKGGYPWTHLYKRPLGPNEEPEIVLLLRKSQELRFPSESPRSLKKVRIHDQVLVQETERYISDLSDTEDVVTTEEDQDTKSAQSETTSISESEDKPISKLSKIKGILKRNRSAKQNTGLPTISKTENDEIKEINDSQQQNSENSPKKARCCTPIMDKLKNMADKQLKKRHIKKLPLKKDEKIILSENQKILKLKNSPKAERSEIAHFIEKRDSDEILEDDKLEIIELEESPSKIRKHREQLALSTIQNENDQSSSVVIPDEIIEIPSQSMEISFKTDKTDENHSKEIPEIVKGSPPPPKKSPRKRKEHVYEDIDDNIVKEKINEILQEATITALKQSLQSDDKSVTKELIVNPKLEEMGSSEESEGKHILSHLAPISSIDSTSSAEDEGKLKPLTTLAEESDQGESVTTLTSENIIQKTEDFVELKITEDHENNEGNESGEKRSVLKREASPATSDKKVTFSHVEDEGEPLREDIELPENFKSPSRWSKMR